MNRRDAQFRSPTAASTSPLLRESIWVGAGVLSSTAAGIVTNLAVPRLMPVADAGAFFLAVSCIVMIPFLARLGLEQGIVRHLAEARVRGTKSDVIRLARTQLAASGLVCGVTALVLSLGGWKWIAVELFHSTALAAAAGAMTLWIVCETLRQIMSEGLRGFRWVFAATWLGNAGRASLFALLLPTLLLVGSRTDRLEWALRLGTCVSVALACLALGLFVWRSGGKRLVGLVSRREVRHAFRLSWPFYITAIWAFASNQGDVLVAGALLSKESVAFYAAASKVSLLLTVPAIALNQLLAPEIPRLWAKRQVQTMEWRIRALTTLYAVPILAGGLLLILANKQVVALLFPPTYAQAAPVLAILAFGPLTNALTGPNAFTLLMTNRARLVSRITAIVSAVQLVFMVSLGHVFGIYGLAVASSAGTVVLNLVCSFVVHRTIGVRTEPFVSPAVWVELWHRLRRRRDSARRT